LFEESLLQSFFVKNVSAKVVRHSLAYLSVQIWLVGYVPLNVSLKSRIKVWTSKRRWERW